MGLKNLFHFYKQNKAQLPCISHDILYIHSNNDSLNINDTLELV